MNEIKLKVNEYVDYIKHIKDDPIENLGKLMPMCIFLTACIGFIVALISFVVGGNIQAQIHDSSFGGGLFERGTIGILNSGLTSNIIQLFIAIEVVVLAIKYSKTSKKAFKIVVIADLILFFIFYFHFMLLDYPFTLGSPKFILAYLTFVQKILINIGPYEKIIPCLLVISIILGAIYVAFMYKSPCQDMIVDTVQAGAISYIVLPLILLVIENVIPIVKLAISIAFLLVIGGAILFIFAHSSSDGVSSSSTSDHGFSSNHGSGISASSKPVKKPTRAEIEAEKKQKEIDANTFQIATYGEFLGIDLYIIVKDGKQYVQTDNHIHPRILCSVDDLKSGKKRIVRKENGQEIKYTDIPFKKD